MGLTCERGVGSRVGYVEVIDVVTDVVTPKSG